MLNSSCNWFSPIKCYIALFVLLFERHQKITIQVQETL